MPRHDYTNPAFCQQSEFYPNTSASNSVSVVNNSNANVSSPFKVQRSESMRLTISHQRRQEKVKQRNAQVEEQLFQQQQQQLQLKQQRIQQRELPPKPGPKPSQLNAISYECTNGHAQLNKSSANIATEGFALVPLEDLPTTSKGRYAVLPAHEAFLMRSSSVRLTRSQDDLDRFSHDEEAEEEDSFMSLPAITPQEEPKNLVSAFSTDFINKSMILVDQSSMQRYAIVPTDDDEEMVDSNHEIIQMHNGRAHRYAVIPTDEEETCLSGDYETKSPPRHNYDTIQSSTIPHGFATPPKKTTPFSMASPKKNTISARQTPSRPTTLNLQQNQAQKLQPLPPVHLQTNQYISQNQLHQQPSIPTKNLATQKLHELLSTPRKIPTHILQRQGSYHTIVHKSPDARHSSQILCSTPKQTEFTPQRLQYEPRVMSSHQLEQRTTAIISPRLQQSIYNDTTSTTSGGLDKSWMHESFQKVENATATIGVISLMLILTGIMNSGLCLYMVSHVS